MPIFSSFIKRERSQFRASLVGTIRIATLALMLLAAVPALATETRQSGGSSGAGASSGSEAGAGSCNAKKEQQDDCLCKKDFNKSFVEKLVSKYDGKPSGHQCLHGVRTAFQETCYGKEGGGWCGEAKDSAKCLADIHYVSMAGKAIPADPPDGAVFVFKKGGEPGHIEVYSKEKKKYCSDFCSDHRVDAKNNAYQLVEWFVPPTEKQCETRNFKAD